MTRFRILIAVAAVLAAAPAGLRAQDDAGIAVGDTAPAVTVPGFDGPPVNLGRYLGHQPVLLEFWATWCTSCAALMPTMRSAYARFGHRVTFLGVNITVSDPPAAVRRYLAAEHPPYQQVLYDSLGAASRAYDVPTTSFVVIVDRQGRVAYTGSGGSQRLESILQRVAGG